jgi:U3 small nucleolar RNA-associated protein 13
MGSFDEILDIALIRDISPEAEDSEDQEEKLSQKEKPMRVAVISNSPHVQIMDSAAETVNLLGHEDVVLSVDASPDGKWLVTSSKDRACRVWSVDTCQCVGLAEGHTDAVGCVAVSQRPSTYALKMAAFISGGSDKVLKRWSFTPVLTSSISGSCVPVRLIASHSVRAHDKDINTVAIAPNDSMVASGSQDSKIRLWTTSDLTPIATLSGHKRSVWRVCFSPVDKCLASCSGDRSVKLWSLADYSCLRTFQGHSASVLCVRFVNNGMQLMSGASDGLINLWTIRSGELQNTFDHHQDKVWSLEVASSTTTEDDAGVFISAGSDSTLVFWSDCTVQEENNRIQAIEEKMLLDQKLGNDIRAKRYKPALRSALQLKYPLKVLEIFKAILEDNEMKLFRKDMQFSFDNIKFAFDEYVSEWSTDDLVQVMTYVKEWNTNSRNSYVVNVLLTSIIRLKGIDELVKIPALADILVGISAYSDRHYQRLDRLHEATYLLEFVNSEMSILTDAQC